MFQRLVKHEGGATLVEFMLLLALIAVVCVMGIHMIGHRVDQLLSSAAGST
jgi:Flp pilus assembly pilin Flp